MADLVDGLGEVLVRVGPGTANDPVLRASADDLMPPQRIQTRSIRETNAVDVQDLVWALLDGIGNGVHDRVVTWGGTDPDPKAFVGSRPSAIYQSAAGATRGAFRISETGVYSVTTYYLAPSALNVFAIHYGATVANSQFDLTTYRAAATCNATFDEASTSAIIPAVAGRFIWVIAANTSAPFTSRIYIQRVS